MNSGTEQIYATSDWHKTQGEAESQCLSELDSLVNNLIYQLESEGKKTVGGVSYSNHFEEEFQNEELFFRCSTIAEINWIWAADKFKSNDPVEGIVNDLNVRINDLISGLIVNTPLNLPRYVIIEDELLNNFKRHFNSGYHSMEIESIVIVASDVKIGERLSSFPDALNSQTYITKNCTAQPRTVRNRLQLTTTESEKFSFERAITTRNEAKFGLTYKAVASASVGLTRELKISSKTEQSFQKTELFEESFEREVQPNKELIVKIQRSNTTDIHDLIGNIIFDGIVKVTTKDRKCDWTRLPGGGRISVNCRDVYSSNKYHLSQILNVSQRTININGKATISSSKNSETSLYFIENEADCNSEVNTYDARFDLNIFDGLIDESDMEKII